MPHYTYTARDIAGKLIKGKKSASSDLDLINQIKNLNQFLINYKVEEEKNLKRPKTVSQGGLPKLKSKELLEFTLDLSVLVNAGITVLSGLGNLAEDAANKSTQRVIRDIYHKIEEGFSIKGALSAQPKTFSKIYVALIGVGEATGQLGKVLNDLGKLLEWEMDLKAKIIEAATYPIILITVMLGVVALLLIKVIPTFEPVFATMGAKLPLPTQFLLVVSRFAQKTWIVWILVTVFGFIAVNFYGATKKGRYILDSLKIKLPLTGKLLYKNSLSRFCHVLSLCVNSGVNVISAMELGRDSVGNARIAEAVTNATALVNQGEKVAPALKSSGIFPPLIIRMIAVGEQSGALGENVNKAAEFYDKEVPQAIKRMFAIFEPMMIVFMGVVVGGIALALFLPLFQMAQTIGQ